MIRGDLSQLGAMRGRIEGLLKIRERTAQAAPAPLTGQVQADFAAHHTPDGVAWPATKHGPRTLYRTGDLQASLRFSARGNRVGAGFIYYGRYQRPPLFIPQNKKLPATYRAILDKVSNEIFHALAAGGRS